VIGALAAELTDFAPDEKTDAWSGRRSRRRSGRRALALACRGAEAKSEAAEAKSGAKSEGALHLSPTQQAAAGITLASPRSLSLAPEVDAFGRVLDPTPYVALVAEEATAKAALMASEKELERVQKLFAAGGNASAQAVEAAEAAAVRDRAAVASAQVRLLAGWGSTLAEHADLSSLRELLAKGAALIRIDLLPGSAAAGAPRVARVTPLGASDSFEVEVLGPAPVADPQVQGASFLALLREHSLPSGASLQVSLQGRSEPVSVQIVPRDAVVFHQGSAWVYVLEKENFERRRVDLGRTVNDQVVIEHGVTSSDRVAVTGAQQLLSAELNSGGTPDER
jgi:hypothetical protein